MVKKILFAAAILLLAPAAAQAQREIVRLTRYDGQTITGVEAGDTFKVELIRSDRARAVVEIDADLERYLRFERRSDGTVSVKVVIPDSERRHIDRKHDWNRRTLKMTVYLPEIQSIHLKDMTHLTSNDAFTTTAVRIRAGDMCRINLTQLTADDVSIELGDMSHASLSVQAGTVTAKVNDMSVLTLNGNSREVNASVNDMSSFTGLDLKAERANVEVSDMSKASVYVTEYLYGRSGDMSSIRYEGNPRQIDLKTPTRTIRTNID